MRATVEGRMPPHIDEDLHPDDGYWITRRKLHGIPPWKGTGGLGSPRDPLRNRGDHYFHSTYIDLVLSGVVGLRAAREYVEFRPLTTLEHWAVSGVKVHDHQFDALWDVSGLKYGLEAGLVVWVDGKVAISCPPVALDVGSESSGTLGGSKNIRQVSARVRIPLLASVSSLGAIVCKSPFPVGDESESKFFDC